MNELQIITEREILGQALKIYGNEENPLFLAKDVATRIEHSDVSTMLRAVNDDEKLTQTMFVSGQNRECCFLTEDGLYEVLMQSRKPIAKEFKKHIKQILKDIRRHDIYVAPQTLDAMLNDPDTMIKTLQALKTERDKVATLKLVNAEMQPKVDYFDAMVDKNLLTNFRDTAKELKVGERAFVKFLIDKRYIYRDFRGVIKPYADKNNGLFEMKEVASVNFEWAGVQTFITPKGRETFRLLLIKGASVQ